MSKFKTSSGRGRGNIAGLTRRMKLESKRRLKPGDKNIFSNESLLKEAEATEVSFNREDLDKYTVNELYEIAYGGDVDYFSSSVFSQQKKNEMEYISNMTRTLNVEESIHECPRCRYTKVIVSQKQLRGGDEGMTTLLRCTKCGYEWKRD